MSTAAAAAARSVTPSGLHRVLGTAFGLAIAVGATIGGGILRTPGEVAAQLPHTTLFMAVWIFGGLNALLGATIYAELGTMTPRSGGIYTYARRAMGDGVGFFVGFTDWLNWCVAPAALILLIGEYLGAMIPALARSPTVTGFATFGAIVLLQWRGVRSGGRTQEVTSVLKTLGLIGLVIAAFVVPHTMPPAVEAPSAAPGGLALVAALAIALQGVIFTYDSYYAVVYCGEELRDPSREIPRSIFRGLVLIIGIYLLVLSAFLTVIPVGQMAGDEFVGGSVARVLFGARGDVVIRSIMIVSLLGTVNAQIMAAPRILHAMSEDGLFPRQATRVNAGGTPSVAMLLSCLVIGGFLFSGSFNAVLGVDAVIIVVLYVVVFVSLFVLRRREPDAPRPYRAWGYPWLQVIALLLALAMVGMMAYGAPRDALITLGLLLASYPTSRLVRWWVTRTGTSARD